jgi:hypothetical protein
MFLISALLRARPGELGIHSSPSICSLAIIRASGLRRGGAWKVQALRSEKLRLTT